MQPLWSIGLMTGTVLDGNIDIALIKTDGERIIEFGAYTLSPYDSATVALLEQAMYEARTWQFNGPEPAVFAEAEVALTRAQANAILQFIDQADLSLQEIGVVGFHGQTVLHRPSQPCSGCSENTIGRTRQLGDGALMANVLGTPVAYDFRSADMRAGGQGAPLSAVYHVALLRELNALGETAVLNLGGVANITWWDGADRIVAFDTGPANAPINDFIKQLGLGDMDRSGALAAAGHVDESHLQHLAEHPYFSAAYPKSLDRFDFSHDMAAGCSAEDGAALLSAFVAVAVDKSLDLLPQRPKRLIVCGGGRHNPTIMRELGARARVNVSSAEDVGWRGDAVEAECFAFLAVRVLRKLPISFPETTGVSRALTGGQVVLPN